MCSSEYTRHLKRSVPPVFTAFKYMRIDLPYRPRCRWSTAIVPENYLFACRPRLGAPPTTVTAVADHTSDSRALRSFVGFSETFTDGPACAWRYTSLRTNRTAGSTPCSYFCVFIFPLVKVLFSSTRARVYVVRSRPTEIVPSCNGRRPRSVPFPRSDRPEIDFVRRRKILTVP